MKKILIGVLCVVLILVMIFALRKNDEKNNNNTLVVGLDDNFPPMGFRDENNEIVGFDIDLAKEVCKRLKMDIRFQAISWASKEQELNSGNIDCIWNGFAYNEERAKTMTLTESYIKGEMYFVLKNGIEIKSQNELKGKKIGVQSGSVQAFDLEKSDFGKEIDIVEYGDFLTAFMDLETGGIDAVFCSSIIGNYIITSKGKDCITIPSQNISNTDGSVIAFKQGNTELRDKIQKVIYELDEDGTLEQISKKWFGKDMTIVKK